MPDTVAIFGGSFDPPHVAHVLAVSYALVAEPVDQVLVVPVYKHAFDKSLAAFAHRVRMCELAMSHLRNVQVSAIESQLGAPSRTLRTLEHLARSHPDWQMRLLVGADVLAASPKWHAFDAIRRLAPPLVLGRAGVPSDAGPRPMLPDVSSTHVRQQLGAQIGKARVRALAGLVPLAVLRYIDEHDLYS